MCALWRCKSKGPGKIRSFLQCGSCGDEQWATDCSTVFLITAPLLHREVTTGHYVRHVAKPNIKSTVRFPAGFFFDDCGTSWRHAAERKISDHSHLVSMRLKCLPGLKQRLQAGKNTWPSIGAGSIGGVILGPLVMRHCYFGGFGLGHQFDSCA